jgi:hypothetical protein
VVVVTAARVVVVGLLALLGCLGLALLVQDVGASAAAGGVGALVGVTAGVVVRWAQEMRITAIHLAGFAAAGVGAFAALHGAVMVGGAVTVASLALFGAWWGLAVLDRSLRTEGEARSARSTADLLRRLPDLDVAALCSMWDDLCTSHPGVVRAHPRDEHLRDLRQRVLDELERRDPLGFARWLATGATYSPARFVG